MGVPWEGRNLAAGVEIDVGPALEGKTLGLFELGTYSVTATFWKGACHELTFMDYGLMSDHETSKFFRETKQLRGEYEKFFAAVLDANSGGSAWEEVTLPGQFRRWKRADVAMSAKGVGLGNITLTTSELNRDRTKSGLDDHRKVLEGL